MIDIISKYYLQSIQVIAASSSYPAILYLGRRSWRRGYIVRSDINVLDVTMISKTPWSPRGPCIRQTSKGLLLVYDNDNTAEFPYIPIARYSIHLIYCWTFVLYLAVIYINVRVHEIKTLADLRFDFVGLH